MSEPNGSMEITSSRGQQVSRKFLAYLASAFASLLPSSDKPMGKRSVFSVGSSSRGAVSFLEYLENQKGKLNSVGWL